MATSQEAPNCFETRIGRNLFLATLVMGGIVAVGAEAVQQATADARSASRPDPAVVQPANESVTVEGVDVPEYMPDYPDGTMIFVEGLGALTIAGAVALARRGKLAEESTAVPNGSKDLG